MVSFALDVLWMLALWMGLVVLVSCFKCALDVRASRCSRNMRRDSQASKVHNVQYSFFVVRHVSVSYLVSDLFQTGFIPVSVDDGHLL